MQEVICYITHVIITDAILLLGLKYIVDLRVRDLEEKLEKYESLGTLSEIKEFYESHTTLIALYEKMVQQREERKRNERGRD